MRAFVYVVILSVLTALFFTSCGTTNKSCHDQMFGKSKKRTYKMNKKYKSDNGCYKF